MITAVEKYRVMADKRKKPPAELRRDYQSTALLREYEEALTAAATRLSEHIAKIEATGQKQVYCDGVKKFTAGFELIDRYINNVEKGMIDAGIR
jgi:hypothetical protein